MTKPKGPGANIPEFEINPEESNPTQPAKELEKAQSSTSNILTGAGQTIPQPSDKDAVDKFGEFNTFNLETTEELPAATPETSKTPEPKIFYILEREP